ncbi:MAG: hypothetical protein Q8Q09_16125 [Deltaproteobacteria bacterium]|nr:hypothetical protein [Deltaproteobacteria bacterium]
MNLTRIALLTQLATTLPLVGLIWLIQAVSYPQFARVGAGEFVAYHQAHTRLITWVVGPLMLGELVGALSWLLAPHAEVPRALAWGGLGMVLCVWLVTGAISVPQHEALASGFRAESHAVLVSSNWLRTGLWTLRGALLLWVVSQQLAPPR